jgi:tetratricopeptide (TPR) repeat protein
MRLWLILAASQLAFANLGAQTGTVPVDTIAEARRLRDANDFAGAAALMRAYVDSHPDDPGSARFAALMAYWSKDRGAADSIYAQAIAHHPDDAELRLEYGRFLVETGKGDRAEEILAPFTAKDSTSFSPQQGSRAHALLGTAAYWRGDFTEARNEFRTSLALDTAAADARRQLLEIETVTASWIRLGTDVWDDDQPLRYATFNAEGGWFLDPLTPLGVRARSTMYDVDGVSESVLTAEASVTSYFPSAHLDLDAAAGLLQRSFDQSTDWTGRLTLGGRLPHTVLLRASYARAPYTNTIRSLNRAIMVQTIEGNARWGTTRGWDGELAARYASYPDENHVSTAFGWILAPISGRETAMLHIGYGFSAQNSGENRFAPRGDISVLPSQGPMTVPGEYNPYYTPQNLVVHSALATTSLRAGRRVVIEAGGSYGFSAHDDAPVLIAVPTPPTTTVQTAFYDRSFNPWNARGSLDWTATPAVRLALRVEHGRDAYYAFTTGRLELTYTFVAAARRRADLH